MIVIDEQAKSVGRMITSNKCEVTFQVADFTALLRDGVWSWTDDQCTRPRSELRYFLTCRSAEQALRKTMEG